MEKKITIKNDVDQIHNLAGEVEKTGEEWELSQALVTNLNLVLEEAVSNIIFYAFEDKQQHDIEITLRLNNQEICVIIMDDGKPFDPTKSKVPEIDLPAEERQIGGLGIFLMGKIMDSMKYERKENQNVLTLKKTIK